MKFIKLVLILMIILSPCLPVQGKPKSSQQPFLSTGETQERVVETWGVPDRKRKIVGSEGKRELWVYDCKYQTPCSRDCDWYFHLPCVYLFFEDGKLTGIHDTR